MARQRYVTAEEAETKLDKAIEMLRRFGRDEGAERFQRMSPAQYAAERGAVIISNPYDLRRIMNVASKADLEASINEIGDLVDDALDPELSREELVAKVKEIAEVVEGGGEGAEEAEGEED